MALITNTFNGLYGGVNQQSAELRLDTQVEEMINAYPTLDKGLLKRNPTKKLELSKDITYSDNMWVYEYDRGLAGDSEEKYSIIVTDDGMQIVNVLTGQVYDKSNGGLTFSPSEAEDYLQPFVNSRGFAATTVKDTTFITNKNVSPKLDPYTQGSGGTSTVDVAEDVIWFNRTPTPTTVTPPTSYDTSEYHKKYAPANIREIFEDVYTLKYILGASTASISVDGIDITYFKAQDEFETGPTGISLTGYLPLTYSEYIENLKSKIEGSLDPLIYIVDMVSDATRKGIRIRKVDGSALMNTTANISLSPLPDTTEDIILDSLDAAYIDTVTSTTYSSTITLPSSAYKQECYIWIKGSNPSSAYTYNFSITSDTATAASSVSNTTTEGAANDIATYINTNYGTNFLAESQGGSVLRVKSIDGADITSMYVGDSYGDQASFGWLGEVSYATDLPKNMPYDGALVEVIGSGNDEASYWLSYSGGQWRESLGYNVQPKLSPSTMPHTLTRNSDDTFTFSEYAWADCKVGDTDSNEPPSFTNVGSVIKDIFFFKNRLGFITNRTVIFSEVGVYNNFWATSVAAILDSDRIDTTIDTTKVIQLEYATYLEDNLMLFSDKAQFKLEGGKILSPKDIQISQTSAYEINKNIRPLFMNDKVFFCAKRGNYTAVMQYSVIGTGKISEAVDISAHIQSYIPANVTRLSGSPINNILFINSHDLKDAIFVYKYYDSANTRVQAAWFKWTFNGEIYRSFSLGRNLNILINRKSSIAVENWVIGTGSWDNSKLWDNSKIWVMDADSLVSSNQFETMSIFPQDYQGQFLDDSTIIGNETIIPTTIGMGEWVFSNGGKKDTRGHLKFKTVQISSEEGSLFELQVEDVKRNTLRTVKSKYTIDRKPMVYGDSKNIRISVTNSDIIGFRINSLSYEGNITKRSSKR